MKTLVAKMMRKSNLGTGSVQRPGALKPRNTDNTPNNRRSAGQQTRKSYLPKASQPDSAKRLASRSKRISAEGINRLSIASGRFTPTRNNAISSNTLAPAPSVSRLSMDSVRNSSMGGKARKEVRPITDSNFKSQCVDKILDFLVSGGYEHQLQRRTLLTPSTKDFANIFNFIYRHLDGQYNMPNRFEEEIPRLLKLWKYPVQMSKSSFITVGSPHTWPSVLAMLAWLVDVVNMFNYINPVPIAFPNDFDSDINLAKSRFTVLVELANCDDDTEKCEAQLEEYRHVLEQAQGVRAQDLLQIQEEDERLEDMVNNLSNGPERLQQLHHQYTQLVADSEKMSEYCRELQVHISAKDGDRSQIESKLAELKAVRMQVFEEVSRLETLKDQQALNVGELARFKNHANEVATIISQLQAQGKDQDSQIWSLEMELGKAQSNLCESICAYNKLVRQLDLPEEFEISSADVSENIHHWQTTLLDDLRSRKKDAKYAMYEAQKQMIRKEEEISMVNEMLVEKKDQMTKLENKLRRVEEDIVMTKNEITAEEKEMQVESDRLHQQILEARKSQKVSLYQRQCALEQDKEELENVKLNGKERMQSGAEFLVRVCHVSLEHLEWQQKEALKHKLTVENVTRKLVESLHTENKE
ncbi:kinetochore protein NDC80 homolog isoform X2 [Penaeus japonicus]|uniref:kinetochore protein NDC80 homolog isoform X2 n=1 Tax=Penaeus japonicus TaxID=27405 RepID=UPI001C70E95C|nr:kinetochore protein NDC80 homolog isoform X2 [Penaeus japonicus]